MNDALVGFMVPYTIAVIVDGSLSIDLKLPTRFIAGTDMKIEAISPDGASYRAVALIDGRYSNVRHFACRLGIINKKER